jgi:hypothetical protein
LSNLPKTPITRTKLLNKIVARLRFRWLLQKLAYTFLIGMCAGLITYGLSDWVLLPLIANILLIALAGLVFSRGKQYQNITANKLLLHLNREFVECEESAELILLPNSSLTTLQRLQKTRIQPQLDQLLGTDLSSHLPKYSYTPAMLLSALALLIFTLNKVMPLERLFKATQVSTQIIDKAPKPSKLIKLEARSIIVTAPRYTGLAVLRTTDLNLELVAGSTVTWQLQFTGMAEMHDGSQQNNLSIMLPDKQRIPLIKQSIQPIKSIQSIKAKQDDNHYLASATLNQSGVYHIAKNNKMLGDMHTIAVTLDSRPSIRFITPTQTITELAKNAKPEVQTTVSIEDDFGLGRVEILASIASGSGEAVKFRDQTFQFDCISINAESKNAESISANSANKGKMLCSKNWDLAELGMQPGDELYFSIRAWDNRLPVAQQSRSPSKIIRWLEEEQQGLLADGIAMDFMPEYFKSQRQIIIETKELIADKTNISIEKFNQTSRELGAAQSFLKQKYGQFLGDEFDSGTLQSMEAGPELDHDDNNGNGEHKEHANETSQTSKPSTHQHDIEEHQTEDADKSGYSQIIQQFGHAHGEADDGNFIKKGLPSPKLLMKRAIANMWQAELHLQLSEPELALPFENQALVFLNRAKKADRIYVKRLGFEPPPVSEKRRYQGDLSDILSYQRAEKTPEKNAAIQSIVSLLNTLNQRSKQFTTDAFTAGGSSPELINSLELINSPELIKTIEQVKAYFSDQLTVNPKDITFIATLEKIQQADSFTLKNCKDCISALIDKLWQTLPSPIAAPATRQTSYSLQNGMLRQYQTFLQQYKRIQQEHEKSQKKAEQP